jgi:hypothetical protein
MKSRMRLLVLVCCTICSIMNPCELKALSWLFYTDFSAGNTDFQSDYPYTPVNTTEGEITVASDPGLWNPGLASAGWLDHSSTSDNLSLLVNGSPTTGLDFWRKTVSVTANTQYEFSGWTSDLNPGANAGRGNLQVYINGTPSGLAFTVPDGEPNWQSFSILFNSGSATTITLSLRDLNLANAFNDFAVDDLSLAAVPEPSAAAFVVLGTIVFLSRRGRVKSEAKIY